MLANLAAALFTHKRITTTETKAKRLRPLAERLVTFAKRGDLHARRRVLAVIGDKSVVHKLFTEIAPQVADREGGYTRITKIGNRKGDNAPMAVIELVLEPVTPKKRAAGQGRPAAEPWRSRGRGDPEVVTEAEAAVDEAAGAEASEESAESLPRAEVAASSSSLSRTSPGASHRGRSSWHRFPRARRTAGRHARHARAARRERMPRAPL